MSIETLKAFITAAPITPGVYTWRDGHGTPLYIGKAANLRARLSSYRKATDSRIQLMMQESSSLDWIQTATDIEALIAESQAIKKLRPKFNIVMRDDKQYFYVGFTKEDFPHIFLTHQPLEIENGKLEIDYMGPFTEGLPLKSTLRTLRSLFPYCTCKQKHHLRCLNAHIGKCPGYCCLKEKASKADVANYRKNIRAIKNILTGKKDTVIRAMERQGLDTTRIRRVFQNAQINARHQALAGQHHGAVEQLESVLGLTQTPHRIEGYDIANIQGEHATGSMVAFVDGRADNQEYRLFNVKTVIGSNDTAMLREVLARRLAHPEWPYPDLILIDGGRGQLNAALKVLTDMNITIPVISLTKNDKHQGDHMLSSLDTQVRSLKNLPRTIVDLIVHIDNEAHRFAINQYRKLHRRKSLTIVK